MEYGLKALFQVRSGRCAEKRNGSREKEGGDGISWTEGNLKIGPVAGDKSGHDQIDI